MKSDTERGPIGAWLVRERERLNLSAIEVALRSGIPQASYRAIEAGRWNPQPGKLERLEAVLGSKAPDIKKAPPPEWATELREQMNGIATRLDAFDEWHRRADELQQDQVVEAATQGAVAAIRTFLDETGTQLEARPKPDPLPSSSGHQESSS